MAVYLEYKDLFDEDMLHRMMEGGISMDWNVRTGLPAEAVGTTTRMAVQQDWRSVEAVTRQYRPTSVRNRMVMNGGSTELYLLGGSSHLVSGLVHPSYKWINPTYPIYNWGHNPLTIRG